MVSYQIIVEDLKIEIIGISRSFIVSTHEKFKCMMHGSSTIEERRLKSWKKTLSNSTFADVNNMYFKNLQLIRNPFTPQCILKAAYSRRNNSNQEKYYEVIGKVKNGKSAINSTALVPVANWELLTPHGYRFFLPGHVGPGWLDIRTSPHSLPQNFDLESTNLKCYAQECPILLRQSITELFAGIDFSYSRLTVISLSQKNLKPISEFELEDVTKKFVLSAQNICVKLKSSGYWADFINPFSGLPGASSHQTGMANLYETDERFRCLGFRIIERQNCRIIEDKKTCRFRGSLFTTAPANADFLRKILLEMEDEEIFQE